MATRQDTADYLVAQMVAHESPHTTPLYDRRDDQVAVDEVERILL